MILWALEDWALIDGWAATNQCDLLTLPARRMVNLIYYRMTYGLEEEGIAALQVSLDQAAQIRNPLLPQPRRIRRLVSVPDRPEPVEVTPVGRWQAAKDWRPAGWNEERSYAAARQFMGFKRNPK